MWQKIKSRKFKEWMRKNHTHVSNSEPHLTLGSLPCLLRLVEQPASHCHLRLWEQFTLWEFVNSPVESYHAFPLKSVSASNMCCVTDIQLDNIEHIENKKKQTHLSSGFSRMSQLPAISLVLFPSVSHCGGKHGIRLRVWIGKWLVAADIKDLLFLNWSQSLTDNPGISWAAV